MPRLMIRIDFDDGSALGPGKIRLLELVAETGSIRKAAAVCGRYMLQHSTQQVTLRFAAEEVAVVTRPRVLARIAADLRELK